MVELEVKDGFDISIDCDHFPVGGKRWVSVITIVKELEPAKGNSVVKRILSELKKDG